MSTTRRPVSSWYESRAAVSAGDRSGATKKARLERALISCAIACEDARRSYTLAAWNAHDPDLHDMFVALLREREQQSNAIERLLGARSSGSKLAFARRAALELRIMFGRDDQRILDACRAVEKSAEASYSAARDTVAVDSQSLTLRELLADHHGSIERSVAQLESEIRALRDA